jgi:hypothetical protein
MKFNRRRAALAALVLALLLLAWLVWPDRRLAQVRALQQELFSEAARSLPEDQRRAKFGELRAAMEGLSRSQRDALAQDGQRRQEVELDRYLAMTPAQKRQHLDGLINRQEEMRKRMQQRAQQRGNRPNGPGGAALGAPPVGRGGPGRRGDSRTPEEREQQRKRSLDRTTPEVRAKRDVLRRDLETRRQQRGLPPAPPFGRGRGR